MAPILSLSFLSLTLAAAVLATPLSTNHQCDGRQGSPSYVAPLHTAEHEAPHGLVDSSYIVMLKKDLPMAALDNHYSFVHAAHAEDPHFDDDSGIRHIFDTYIKGYSGKFTEQVLQRIREMPEVDYVERDQIVKTQNIQTSAPWGLARISHRPKLTIGTFDKYEFAADGGKGVDVYVIDTGIDINHNEFEHRATWGKTIPKNDVDKDNNGHGTHCAGTIASRKYGVAKAANVIAVKVLGSNGKGTLSDVVAGVLFAAKSAAEKAKAAAAERKATGSTKHKGSVVNMSLGGGFSQAINDAVEGAVESGLHFAVAAGNDNHDACLQSPGSAKGVISVGASTLYDQRANFSNFGPCVDVFAPGVNILSTYIGSKDAQNTKSGTSMASPHIAGLLAYLLSIYPSATFDPSTSSLIPALELDTQPPFTGSFTGLYDTVYNVMPGCVSAFMPPPRLIVAITAPIELKPLSPADLKSALIGLASEAILTQIPEDTVNLLAFNNFTSSS